MRKLIVVSLVMLALTADKAAGQYPQGSFEFEAGPVWQTRNDVQIPNTAAGTRFSLRDLVGSGPWVTGRIYTTIRFAPKHEIRLLVAPLTIEEKSKLDADVRFAGGNFARGPVTTRYTFNSYRLTYRYRYHAQRWKLWVGFTAKVRDAVIKLHQSGVSEKKTDLGFVPLLHLAGEYPFTPRSGFLFDLDALAGGPGRAEDLALKLYHDLNLKWRISAGYRTVEGGADVDEVFTFAWLHYVVISLKYRL